MSSIHWRIKEFLITFINKLSTKENNFKNYSILTFKNKFTIYV